MRDTLFSAVREHLAEMSEIYNKLVNNGFGHNVTFEKEEENATHMERANQTLLILEQTICDLVEELNKRKGQVA